MAAAHGMGTFFGNGHMDRARGSDARHLDAMAVTLASG